MEKELLQRALDSILHGSTQVVSHDDGYGNIRQETVRVNDLRLSLIESIAKKLAESDGFKQAFEKALTQDVINLTVKKITENITFSTLSYDLQRKIQDKLKMENVTLNKFKIVIEAVEKE